MERKFNLLKNGLIIAVIGFSVLGSGCASQYQMTNGALSFQSKLTKDSAESFVISMSKPMSDQRGLCVSILNFSSPKSNISDYDFKQGVLTYEAAYTKKISSTLNGINEKIAKEFPDTKAEFNAINIGLIETHAAINALERNESLDRDKSFTVKVSVPKLYTVDFANLEEIRVFDSFAEDDHRACTSTAPGKYFVWLAPFLSNANTITPKSIRYNISEDNIEKFIAALSFLSPQAALVKGPGFY
jgi:hypothetical protein